MPALIRFLVSNFCTGAVLGMALALWMVREGIGPGAAIVGSGEAFLATALFVKAMAATLGLGFLATAVLMSERD